MKPPAPKKAAVCAMNLQDVLATKEDTSSAELNTEEGGSTTRGEDGYDLFFK